MVELVSHYVMPGEKESETEELIRSLGLDGIENLVYGTTPSETPFTKLSVGAHLKFWPDWVDFYIGNREEYKKESSAEGTHIPFCGADTPEGWLEEIRKNIRAALAEKPAYLVWHVANCRIEEAWTGKFRYSSKEVLDLTAEIYKKVKGEVPPDVEVLFENIFWPGLSALTPEELDYFFSRLPYDNVGVMLDLSLIHI